MVIILIIYLNIFFYVFQKQEKRRETRLKKFWRSPKTSSEDSGGGDSPTKTCLNLPIIPKRHSPPNKPTCSLPLLQVWPSQDSPRGEADGQSFVFPVFTDEQNRIDSRRRSSLFCDTPIQAGDSGIDSVQASPSPNALPCPPGSGRPSPSTTPTSAAGSPTPSIGKNRRPSSALLHPDHARLFALRQQLSPDQVIFGINFSLVEICLCIKNGFLTRSKLINWE